MAQLARRTATVTVALFIAMGAAFAPSAEALTSAEKLTYLERELNDVSHFWFMYANRGVSPYNEFDWSTDLCSWSPDQPLGFDFRDACRRHDFNYRNYKAVGAFTEAKRLQIDNAFKADMYAKCATYSWWQRSTCRGTANSYYWAVRNFGAS
jgi:hypothetical protein